MILDFPREEAKRMRMRRIVLTAALACAAPAAAAAQTPQATQPAQAGPADSAWVNLVTIRRLRDDFADRPDEAIDGFVPGHPTRPWGNWNQPVVLPEPFRSRTFAAQSFVLLDVDTAGRAAGCRPLRAGAHPELDALACTLLMRPGYFVVSPYPPSVQPRARLAGRWVMGLRWESLTAAAHRQRESSFSGTRHGVARAPAPPRPRQIIRGQLSAADYRRIADQRMSHGLVEAHLAVNERGVATSCRVSHSSGNPAIDERTCALLLDQARFEERVDSSGTAVADSFKLQVDVDELLPDRPPFAQSVEVGQTVNGRLESGDRVRYTGAFYDAYTVTAPRTRGIRITLQSAELHPFLAADFDKPPYRTSGRWSGTRGDPDFKTWVDVPAGARVRIEARALMEGMQGAYTLQVTAN
jgi:hypothetical protein